MDVVKNEDLSFSFFHSNFPNYSQAICYLWGKYGASLRIHTWLKHCFPRASMVLRVVQGTEKEARPMHPHNCIPILAVAVSSLAMEVKQADVCPTLWVSHILTKVSETPPESHFPGRPVWLWTCYYSSSTWDSLFSWPYCPLLRHHRPKHASLLCLHFHTTAPPTKSCLWKTHA